MSLGSVVVTGAGDGIGHAIAVRLAADGWNVVGLEINPETASDLGKKLGKGHDCLCGDASDRAVLKKVREAAEKLAPLRGWVNNVGIALMGNLHEPKDADVERVFAVNLMSHFWGSSEAIQTWVRDRVAGSIVNVSSVHGRSAFNMWAAYDVAKAGIDALTRYIAVEYGPVGIRANAVAPGAVRTSLVQRVIRDSPDSTRAEREMSIQHPLERIGEPEEIAAAVSWLISSEASFVTGQSLAVDGGLTSRCYRYEPDAALLERYGKVS
ncbi:SDR family oxidoreductase [Mesorhizobium sp. B3-1-3]|uniref:SDR family NAD(P)-dependent oxidoreductase n=1 Tax=unclassified Mesorhizobium TaxID=325217 RepID=UPI001126341B|nr:MULTISPECIES: SDR family oxidoreductase [unclassified Mesorhizobium]TPI69541.1 SDR family oxidoreductase [Mesorhizobium sp. B3-1-8]TPI73787.1 SDR family oxidoreductase [Mesorhizobium sp. B3-1-3]